MNNQETNHKHCPSCGKQWTDQEQEYQQCDKCGYPINQPEDGHYEGDWDREFDDDTDD